jgi:hypothetical protein
VTGALARSLPLGMVAASVALAGCGGGSPSSTPVPAGQAPPPPSSPTKLTPEEMREYDANEGRCHDDGGSVRNVGTIDAYCAFPARSNDFHLIESSSAKKLAAEEE